MAIHDSPQANLPRLNEILQIKEPQIVDLASAAAVDIYNKATEPKVVKMFIHNVGLNPIKYSMNQVATDTVYHDVLAADVASESGLGTKESFDFQNVGIDRISVKATAGSGKLAVIKFAKQ